MYLSMISILTLNAIALPWTLIPTAVLVVLFVIMLRWYLNAAQAIKRLEATSKLQCTNIVDLVLLGRPIFCLRETI